MLPALRERYNLTILDVKTTNREGEEVPDVVIADLTNRDREAYRAHFRGQDAIIHCGFVRAQNPEDPVLDRDAEHRHGPQRVSDLRGGRSPPRRDHQFQPRGGLLRKLDLGGQAGICHPGMYPLSDNFYGWAKAQYELLGFTFAAGLMNAGQKLENVQIRIGGPRETDMDRAKASDLKRMHRGLGAYLSIRDQVQLIVKSIEAETIENDYGIPFQIFLRHQRQRAHFWTISNARKKIGYEPEDNSQVKFAAQLSKVLLEARENYPEETA